MESIFYLIFIPFISGMICIISPPRLSFGKNLSKFISVITTTYLVYLSIMLFISHSEFSNNLFLVDNLNRFIVPTISIFGFLAVLFSLRSIREKETVYFGYILFTLAASFGTVLARDMRLIAVFWGFLGLTLYMLINCKGPESSTTAKKTLIIIGGSDAFMLVGIAILWHLTGTFTMPVNKIQISGSSLSLIAFICLLIAAFAKAGVMPFHTWIPDMAEASHVPVTALLPASLDKLLGIYLLARISLDIFILNNSISLFLMSIGSITIICAVFMAMIQHDLKRLLSYHAVSQVGYMVLGIGTGNPIGIAGGIFHMLNHTLYKSSLFLSGGSVEYRTNTSDLDKLGGLVKYMPVTFISFLIAALAISGIPPLNGFVSKWMIYQSIIIRIIERHSVWDVIFLVTAIFGSALTLASFMKLIHAIFLGKGLVDSRQEIGSKGTSLDPNYSPIPTEVNWTMWLPTVVLSGLCIVFGIFAFQLPLRFFVLPVLSTPNPELRTIFIGLWSPGLATVLIILGIFIGLLVYLASKLKVREIEPYIGGETIPADERVTGVDFYQTIRDMRLFKAFYYMAEKKIFDIYDWGKTIVFGLGNLLSSLHTGNLHTYIVWCLIGMLALFYVVLK